MELIEKAIALDPSQPGFHSNLALSLNEVGRARDAIESCDRAIALDPGCSSIGQWPDSAMSL